MKMRTNAARFGGAGNVLAADIPGDGEEGFRGFDPLERFSLFCSVDDDDDKGGGGGDDDDDDAGADDALAKVTANNAKLTNELKEARKAIREAKAAEDARKAEELEKEEEAARKKGDFDKTEQRLTAERDAAKQESDGWKAKYEDKLISLGLTTGLDAAKVKPELREAVTSLLKAKADFELDEDGAITVDGKPLSEYIAAWAKSDEGKHFVLNGAKGADTPGGGSGKDDGDDVNPWEPGKISLGKQAEILKNNRDKARQLAAVHGVKIA